MRNARAAGWVGAATLLVAAIASAQPSGEGREAWVADLLTSVRARTTAAGVREACAEPLPSGVTCERSQTSRPCTLPSGELGTCETPAFTVSFDPPVAARPIVRALRIRSPRVVSGDVHQESWSIAGTRPYRGPRRARVPVRVGAWRVRVHVEQRPSGRLPRERVGASPAYRVRASTKIDRLSFELDATAH